MAKSYLSKSSVRILDKTYQVYFMNNRQYDGAKESRAYCAPYERYLVFNVEQVVPRDGVVIHEMSHAYAFELFGRDLDMTPNQTEEFFCTVIEKHAADILSRSRPLTKQLMAHAKRLKRKSPQRNS